jgi:hypothetical protein
MLTLLLAAATAGYVFRQHSNFSQEDGMLEIHLNLGAFWDDIRHAWTALSALCAWVIATARACRQYLNVIIRPWAAGYGLQLPLIPALMLPRSAESLIDFDALEDRITDGLPKFIA